MRSMIAVGLVAMLATVAPVEAQDADLAEIPLTVTYSLDGQTFTQEPPVMEPGGRLKVRVSWAGFERPDESRQPYLAVLVNDRDFASANNGAQTFSDEARRQRRVYLQRPTPSWLSRDTEQVDFALDLGARPTGVMGQMNKWDAEAGKFIDAELPPCEALPDGEHSFTVKIYYRPASGASGGGAGFGTFTVRVESN